MNSTYTFSPGQNCEFGRMVDDTLDVGYMKGAMFAIRPLRSANSPHLRSSSKRNVETWSVIRPYTNHRAAIAFLKTSNPLIVINPSSSSPPTWSFNIQLISLSIPRGSQVLSLDFSRLSFMRSVCSQF